MVFKLLSAKDIIPSELEDRPKIVEHVLVVVEVTIANLAECSNRTSCICQNRSIVMVVDGGSRLTRGC